MRINVGVDYNTPPTKVKDVLQATLHAEGVQKDPEPKVFLKDFGDFAINYEIKFWMLNHQDYNNVCDAIRSDIWYKFKPQKIVIPFPIRTLEIHRKAAIKPQEEHNQTKAILKGEPLFNCLTGERSITSFGARSTVRFGRGEKIIEQRRERRLDVRPAPRVSRRLGLAKREHDPG